MKIKILITTLILLAIAGGGYAHYCSENLGADLEAIAKPTYDDKCVKVVEKVLDSEAKGVKITMDDFYDYSKCLSIFLEPIEGRSYRMEAMGDKINAKTFLKWHIQMAEGTDIEDKGNYKLIKYKDYDSVVEDSKLYDKK